MDTFKLVKKLVEAAGPSGNEEEIARVIERLWRPYVDASSRDAVGNLIAVKRGQGTEPRRRVLLAAHMDEIALMVNRIVQHQGNGFLRVVRIGGVDHRQLFSQRVVVHGRRPMTGVIGCLPSSMLPEARRDKPFGYEDLLVDVGLPIAEVERLVSIGDFVTFHQPLRQLKGKRIAGKALDNRASVAAVTICLEYLQQRSHSWDVIAVATSQEETRLLGAYASAYSQQPDLAVAIDVGHARGPGASEPDNPELGSGPILDIGPNVHIGVYRALQAAAESIEMATSTVAHARSSGTDAFALQVARAGIPTGLISIPIRYMHTKVESADLRDVERSGRLLGEFIAQLDADFLDKMAESLVGEDR